MKSGQAGLAAALVLAMTHGALAQPRGGTPLRTGRWGGDHVVMEVESRGVRLDFDCAHGRLASRPRLDAKGHFEAEGTFAREHGGPQRADETTDGEPARYVGQLQGEVLTLTISMKDADTAVGTFTLRYGRTPRLVKCR